MVIALIALFVSLSGVSYGVATGFIDSREIKNNQVRSIDIRNNEIRTRDLRNNQVRGIDIRNSSVQGRDIALNTVTGNDVNESTLGKVPSARQRGHGRIGGHRRLGRRASCRRKITYSAARDRPRVHQIDGRRARRSRRAARTPAARAGRARIRRRAAELRDRVRLLGWFANADTDFDPGDDVDRPRSPARRQGGPDRIRRLERRDRHGRGARDRGRERVRGTTTTAASSA